MASRPQWRRVGLLLVVTAVFALLLSPSDQRSALDPRATAFRATPNGVLALYLMLEEIGVPVERRTTPLADGEPLPAALALLAPSEPLSPAEVGALLTWIEGGGRLLYVAAPRDGLTAALGLALVPVSGDTTTATGAATATTIGQHRLTREVQRVFAFEHAFADSSTALTGEAEVLLRIGDGGVGAALLQRGRGEIIAWSDPGPLANHSLQSAGAAVIFARAAREFTRDGEALQFDEFHHGFRGGGSPVGALAAFLSGTPFGRMSLQLALAGGGVLLLLGSRFGAPRPPVPMRRRSPLEHLHALAGAYHAGNARHRAAHLIMAGVARRMGRPPPAAGEEMDFLGRLGTRSSARRAAARALLEEWQKGEGADLITLADRADRLVLETKTS